MSRKCSFCSREETEVNSLISGPEGVFICDDCVEICLDILRESDPIYYKKHGIARHTIWDEQPLFECALKEEKNNYIIAGKSIIALLDDEHIYAPVTGKLIYDSKHRGEFTRKGPDGEPAIECISSEDTFHAPISGTVLMIDDSGIIAIEGDGGLVLFCSLGLSDDDMYKENVYVVNKLVEINEKVLAGQPVLKYNRKKSLQLSLENPERILIVIMNPEKYDQKRCGNFYPVEQFMSKKEYSRDTHSESRVDKNKADIMKKTDQDNFTFSEDDYHEIFGDLFGSLFDKPQSSKSSEKKRSEGDPRGYSGEKKSVEEDKTERSDSDSEQSKVNIRKMDNLHKKADDLLHFFEDMNF